MKLKSLHVHNVRNIRSLKLSLSPRFNFISGPNGSGKTSLLEALYILSCGHSFRSRELSPIVMTNQDALTVFAKADDESTISIQKSNTLPTQIKLNNQLCATKSELAYTLPCLVFYTDIFQIVDAGPSVRRTLLDWGLFHVKPEYFSIWKEYKRALKQRNTLLRKRAAYSQFIPWDMQLSQLSEALHTYRSEYFSLWKNLFYTLLPKITDTKCTIDYIKGWDKKSLGHSLDKIFKDQFDSDMHRQYTSSGAHQADIVIESQDEKARTILSRGQQKIILIALKLAQAQLLSKPCLYLFDDLAAELDSQHQHNIISYLKDIDGQYIITGIHSLDALHMIDSDNLSLYTMDSFHIHT